MMDGNGWSIMMVDIGRYLKNTSITSAANNKGGVLALYQSGIRKVLTEEIIKNIVHKYGHNILVLVISSADANWNFFW